MTKTIQQQEDQEQELSGEIPFPTDEELLAMKPDILARAAIVRQLIEDLEKNQIITGEILRKEFII